jgi:hypothetical protein
MLVIRQVKLVMVAFFHSVLKEHWPEQPHVSMLSLVSILLQQLVSKKSLSDATLDPINNRIDTIIFVFESRRRK